MYRIEACRICGVSDRYNKICQSTQLCASCHISEEYKERVSHARLSGISCPQCGSTNYSEGTYHEECHSCGHEQGY